MRVVCVDFFPTMAGCPYPKAGNDIMTGKGVYMLYTI